MASVYSQAVTSSAGARRASTRALGMAKKNLLKTKEFELDEQINFDKLAKKASKKFGSWKSIGSLIGTGLAWATGMGPLAAALTAAGSTVAGGAIGGKKAGDVMKDTKWFSRTKSDLQEGMGKQTMSSALVAGVMAGSGAKGAQKTPDIKGASDAAAETVTKTGVGDMQLAKGLDQSKISQFGWKTEEGKTQLAQQMAESSDEAISKFGKEFIESKPNWGDAWKESFGTDWSAEAGQAAWDEQFLQGGEWGDKGQWLGPEQEITTAVEKPFGSDFEYKRNPIFSKDSKAWNKPEGSGFWKERPQVRSWEDIKKTYAETKPQDVFIGEQSGRVNTHLADRINIWEDGVGKMNKLSDMFQGGWTQQAGRNIWKAGSSFFDQGSSLKSGLTLMQMLGQNKQTEKYPWERT